MPTTIDVNAAGYDLDAGGTTGSIVSGTLFLGHHTDLGGQLRAKAITDTPAIIAQAYSGTAKGFEVWDSLGNVVASVAKTGMAVFGTGAQGIVVTNDNAGHANVTVATNTSVRSAECGFIDSVVGNSWRIGRVQGDTSFYVQPGYAATGNISGSNGLTISNTGAIIVAGGLTLVPAASATPATNGQLTFEATSNTSLTIKYKGSDGTVRSNILTLS